MIFGYHGTPLAGTSVRVFPNGQDKYDKNRVAQQIKDACVPVLQAGLDPMPSIKFPYDQPAVDNGAPAVVQAVKDLNAAFPGRKIRLVGHHEPENDGVTPEVYVHTMDDWGSTLLNNLPLTFFEFGAVFMAYQWDADRAGQQGGTSWFPSFVDFYGVDAYSHVPGGDLSSHAGFQNWYAAIRAGGHGKANLWVVERGFDVADVDQADLIRSDVDYLEAADFAGYQYWNQASNGHAYPLGPTATQAFTDAQALPPPPRVVTYTQDQVDAAVKAARDAAYPLGYGAALKYVTDMITATPLPAGYPQ